MLFTSSAFLLFLSVLVIIYALTPQRYRRYTLLVGSMVFYGFAGVHFLLYINATIIITYLCTIAIHRKRIKRDAALSELSQQSTVQDRELSKETIRGIKSNSKATAKKLCTLNLVLILGILAVVKYSDFTISNVNSVLGLLGSIRRFGLLGIALPLGISFYTFQTVGYVIDVYREKAEIVKNPFKLALFVSFFPQVVQGPISRFGELSKTLYTGTPLNTENLTRGATRILWGFFKKLVIADRLWPALVFLTANADDYQGIYYLLAITLYAVVLYCDFSGGIDIAIGAAELFGIRLPENFNRPFYSRSIQEYWQRWHMTMYSWFRDYVFYPMAASKRMLRISKAMRGKAKRKSKLQNMRENFTKRLPVHISLIFVWFLTGLWHGATWNFIAWGLANGVVLMISLELAPLYEKFNARFHGISEKRLWRIFQVFRTFWLMNFIRSFDIYSGVKNTFRMMGSVLTNFSLSEFQAQGILNLTLPISDYIAAAAGLLFVFLASYLGRAEVDFRDRLSAFKWPLRYAVIGVIFFMALILGAYGHGFDARQFIYNMF